VNVHSFEEIMFSEKARCKRACWVRFHLHRAQKQSILKCNAVECTHAWLSHQEKKASSRVGRGLGFGCTILGTFLPLAPISTPPMAHTCNPSYLRGWDQQDHGSKPAQANSLWDPISKYLSQK
jgi:hypothetical protein